MRVELNGQPSELAEGTSVAALIETLTGSARGSAVAVDGEVVPRGRWSEYQLRDGQTIELLTAVQGG
jgi:sulfur carrier protein